MMASGLGLQTQRLRWLRTRRLGPWQHVGGHRVARPGLAPELPPAALSRLARVNLDLAFRTRAEAALMRVAYHGRAIARVTVRGGALFLMGALAAIPLLPLMSALLGLGGFLLLAVGAIAKTASVAAHIPASATRALRLQRWSTVTAAIDAGADGGRVRVRGRIRALRTIPALDGRAAVLVSVRATRQGRGTEVHKGQDFLLDDGTGVPTRVEVAQALFLDRPLRLFGSWHSPPLESLHFIPAGTTPIDLQEAALFEGDEVEVVGRAEMVVDPSVGDRLARDTPLVRVLTGTADEPLLLERVG